MIEITVNEAKIVRKHYPCVCIAKTKNKRYLEESVRYLCLLPNNLQAVNALNEIRKETERRKRYYGTQEVM